MEASIGQTITRRRMQGAYNEENGIVPKTIEKALPVMGAELEDLFSGVAGTGKRGGRRMVAKPPGRKGLEGLAQKFKLGAGIWNTSDSVLDNVSQPEWVEAAYETLEGEEGDATELITRLEREMRQAAARLDFERAASLRDRIFKLQNATN
jgi:excinuclease UvrABC helicase subunit UvrB